MHVVIIIVGRTGHPCWVNAIFSTSYLFSSFLVVASWEYIVAAGEFYDLYFELWLGVRGGWVMGVVPIMHTTSMLSPGEAFAPQEARGCKGVAMSGEFFPVLYC